ncbi:long-chain-fatty-acid--CoA ligase [Burkholderia sp. R-69980]|jgi:Acyl-CoA synthetases (AMP-forming)/AMP-acid ligases II|nr:long-chain-fatty-acid--CoA ligase [Burkholderia sp. R-69980]MCI0152022.1 long-chain-fatty-acid--CoA ligase [Paraburkholderia sediminicola]
MEGLMMQQPLLVASLLAHAERHHGNQEIVSRRVEGDLHRYRFADLAQRSRRMANALTVLGIKPGERVGTLAWNGYRHMELYFAVSGSGAVLHTLNPRLHVDQLVYIIDHAEDQVVFFDLGFLPLIEMVAARVTSPKVFVAMTGRAHMPATHRLPVLLLCYEDLIDAHSEHFAWPLLDENAASSLCYTSGTTGNPKGVLYSHRSTVLHTYAAALPDALNCSARDAILPVVPMFHVNAWGLPYIACMVGAKLVFPGPALDGKSLYELIESEQVTLSAGVPTVWQGLLTHVSERQGRFSSMRRTVIGGAPCSTAMTQEFQERHHVDVLHAWGMTELSPVGTVCSFKSHHLALPPQARYAIQAKQGRAVFGVDMKIVDADSNELPWDGVSAGDLLVRGPWVTRAYFRSEKTSPLHGGWFPTGDVVKIDPDGFMQVTDRSKDVIKSGGEWISSIDIENVASLHPEVENAVCIAARHPKWDERPLLLVLKKPGSVLTVDELLAFIDGKVAKWWKPDAVVFIDEIPLGATGKVLKNLLRDQFQDYYLSV